MNNPNRLRIVALAAALGSGAVLAQTQPAPGTSSAPALSDAAPPPAEDRSSAGAIVLDQSLVRAQRNNEFERSAARSGVASVGRGAVRAAMQRQTEADLAQARREEMQELRGRGAGSLVER